MYSCKNVKACAGNVAGTVTDDL